MIRAALAATVAAAALPLLAACAHDDQGRAADARPRCPAQFRGEWQELANRVEVPVYCPTWLPDPLVGEVHHPSVDPDRSYQIGFHDSELRSAETHVVLAAYPNGKAPRCEDLDTGKIVSCWLEPSGTKRIRGIEVTVYERGLGHESQHLVYAWTSGGTLYSASNHIDRRENSAIPRPVAERNLERIMRGLVRIKPRKGDGHTHTHAEDAEH